MNEGWPEQTFVKMHWTKKFSSGFGTQNAYSIYLPGSEYSDKKKNWDELGRDFLCYTEILTNLIFFQNTESCMKYNIFFTLTVGLIGAEY